ncbi:g4370 [Coccomyxa elongata]
MTFHQLGLECKAFWCEKLLRGEKDIELRQYPLPPEFLDRTIWLLASRGEDGVSSLGDTVEAGSPFASVVGWVRFSCNKEYHCSEDWEADQDHHRVPKGSPYGWQQGETTMIYGWVVQEAERLPSPLPMPAASRIERSLFTLHMPPMRMEPCS